jgi:NAD(P)-dependent dehydrogenase (short-subunit alcohol dehydrogenase family)
MGQRSLVLVGAGDIALATAKILREEDYDTAYIMTRGQSAASRAAAEELKKVGYEVTALTCDVTDWQSLNDAASEIDQVIDSLVYSPAGQRVFKELHEINQEDWDQSFDVFVGGFVGSVKALSPRLKPGATLVAMSGTSAQTVISSRHLAMGSAKAALEHAVAYLSDALAHRKIRVNGVACGPVETSSNKELLSSDELEALRMWQSSVTLPGRLGQPEDIGRIVAALCGPAFEWMTGEVILADGGALKRTSDNPSEGNPLETLLEPGDLRSS